MMTATASSSTYQERARLKRARRDSLIPAQWRLASIPSATEAADAVKFIREYKSLSARELSITETSDVNVLLQQLASRQLSSVEVTAAFAKRAMLAQQLTNCCTEIFLEDAFAQAVQLDEYLSRNGKPMGPLHGLPVSVKDLFHVKGVDSCVGWVGLTERPAVQDGNVATMLRRLGAVLYVKTNVPQSLMMSDSFNHVFGQAVSALNRNLISGGSSGGESSLVSARGSILGVGTDIGGSIRIPASLCGLYGLSPSTGRHPYERNGLRQDIIRSVAGPIAVNLSTIEKYMESLPAAMPWEIDHQVIPITWRKELCTTTERLRIGYVVDDGVVQVQPPVERAVKEVISALKEMGHEVIEWDASTHAHAYNLWEKAILSDGGEACRKLCELSGEPLIEGMLVGRAHNIMNTSEMHQLIAEKYAYEAQYLQRWTSARLDALIMPITPWVAYKPQTWVKSQQYVGYTSISNLLDYPALAIPVTCADRTRDSFLDDKWTMHRPRNPSDDFNHKQYDINLVHGAPVGVQVVTPKLQEEKCIAVAKVISDCLAMQQSSKVLLSRARTYI